MLVVRVDTFPVVVTTFGDGFQDSDFASYRDAHTAIVERRQPYVSVVDTSALETKVTLHAALRPAVSRALDAVWTNQLETSAELLAYHDEVMSTNSMPPARESGSFARRALSSSIEGLLRRARKVDER